MIRCTLDKPPRPQLDESPREPIRRVSTRSDLRRVVSTIWFSSILNRRFYWNTTATIALGTRASCTKWTETVPRWVVSSFDVACIKLRHCLCNVTSPADFSTWPQLDIRSTCLRNHCLLAPQLRVHYLPAPIQYRFTTFCTPLSNKYYYYYLLPQSSIYYRYRSVG